jgi:SAM-dependent methyltransferase
MDPARARAFDAWAADYDRFRPGYPVELFETIATQLALPRRPEVTDLGAGTGQASRAMATLGWRVTAVEPGKSMLDVLRARAAEEALDIAIVQRSAEDTGLPSGSADLVTAAASFHWFDQKRALDEVARILKPGGGLAVFWNDRDDERSAFLADVEEAVRRYVADGDTGGYSLSMPEGTTRSAIEAHGDTFSLPTMSLFRHETQVTADEFIGLVFTNSYVRLNKTPQQQETFRGEVAALLRHHHLTNGQQFAVPYRLELWTARKSGR